MSIQPIYLPILRQQCCLTRLNHVTTYNRRPETPEQENLEVGDGDHTSRRRRLVTAPERKGCILGNQDFFKREFNRVYQKHILSDFPQHVEVRSSICYVVLKGERLK